MTFSALGPAASTHHDAAALTIHGAGNLGKTSERACESKETFVAKWKDDFVSQKLQAINSKPEILSQACRDSGRVFIPFLLNLLSPEPASPYARPLKDDSSEEVIGSRLVSPEQRPEFELPSFCSSTCQKSVTPPACTLACWPSVTTLYSQQEVRASSPSYQPCAPNDQQPTESSSSILLYFCFLTSTRSFACSQHLASVQPRTSPPLAV